MGSTGRDVSHVINDVVTTSVLTAEGMSAREIAERLAVSARTVRTYRAIARRHTSNPAGRPGQGAPVIPAGAAGRPELAAGGRGSASYPAPGLQAHEAHHHEAHEERA